MRLKFEQDCLKLGGHHAIRILRNAVDNLARERQSGATEALAVGR